MGGGSEVGPGPFPVMLMCWGGLEPLSQESLLLASIVLILVARTVIQVSRVPNCAPPPPQGLFLGGGSHKPQALSSERIVYKSEIKHMPRRHGNCQTFSMIFWLLRLSVWNVILFPPSD